MLSETRHGQRVKLLSSLYEVRENVVPFHLIAF